MNLRKLPVIFLFLALLHLITIITAPFTIPPGTLRDLDGNANKMDYQNRWEDLNLYARVVYSLGDYNCHQKSSRSYYLNENQLPVCSRDTGLAIGFVFGSLLFVIAIPYEDPLRMLLTPILRERVFSMSKKVVITISITFIAVFMLPMAADGLIQGLTAYESTNTIRIITGILFGTAFIVVVGTYLESIIYKYIFKNKTSSFENKN